MNERTVPGHPDSKSGRYRAYLLRVWSTHEAGASVERASLEEAGTGRVLGFASLEELFVYLLEQNEAPAGAQKG